LFVGIAAVFGKSEHVSPDPLTLGGNVGYKSRDRLVGLVIAHMPNSKKNGLGEDG
jgi:hypothetical protein